ncbi:hypothetical protein C1646_775733 [Rhizophagus diaphanus]|nr:hypothetical protein C1646_775733 [Rhizophagus diaphanus] [Rhizophagus sp. MUCL 43196]
MIKVMTPDSWRQDEPKTISGCGLPSARQEGNDTGLFGDRTKSTNLDLHDKGHRVSLDEYDAGLLGLREPLNNKGIDNGLGDFGNGLKDLE